MGVQHAFQGMIIAVAEIVDHQARVFVDERPKLTKLLWLEVSEYLPSKDPATIREALKDCHSGIYHELCSQYFAPVVGDGSVDVPNPLAEYIAGECEHLFTSAVNRLLDERAGFTTA
jgi:hypothetical protein